MTSREREFAALGIEYAEGVDRARGIALPNGRVIERDDETDEWIVGDDRYDDALDACRAALAVA